MNEKTTKQIVDAVRHVVGEGKIELHEPYFPADTYARVSESIRDLKQGRAYSCVDEFQTKIAQISGTEQALVLSSGTAALHVALTLAGVAPHTEVLVPALTFVGTANAVCYCSAIPNFVDVRLWDYGIHPFKLQQYLQQIAEKRETGTYNKKTGRRIAALIVVDLLGVPADIDAIKAVCGRWGLPMIEDAAQALGSIYKGRPCGGTGYMGILSFNNNKIVTTNGGGALLTDDPFIQAKAWSLATTARLPHPWFMNHSEVAWNYRMGNINAACGLPQLEILEKLVDLKTRLHKAYAEALDVKIEGELEPASRCNFWLNAITLDPLDHRRDEIMAALHADGIACRALFAPLDELPMFKSCPRDNLDGARSVWRRTICIPSSAKLGERFI